jgi:hypothetical protein
VQHLAQPELSLKLETQHQGLEASLVRPIKENALPGRRSDATIQAQRRGFRGNMEDQSATRTKPLGPLRQFGSAGGAYTENPARIVAACSSPSWSIHVRKNSANRAPSSQRWKAGSKKVRDNAMTPARDTPKRTQAKFCLTKCAHASRPAAISSSPA